MYVRWAVRKRHSVRTLILFVIAAFASGAMAQHPLPDAPSATKAGRDHIARVAAESSWPRTFTSGNDTFILYPPEVDKWEGNVIDFYCAVELRKGTGNTARYGVVWLQARTEVDKINHLVTLDEARVTKVTFPAALEQEAQLTALLQKKLPGLTKRMSLDRLEAAIDIDNEVIQAVEVKNDPPRVIIVSKPSLLVLVDGTPQLREVSGTGLRRVINTTSIILSPNKGGLYYLRVNDLWFESVEVGGPWKYAENVPDEINQFLVIQNLSQKVEGDRAGQLPTKPPGNEKVIPVVYVVFEPAELIETAADAKYDRIPGTSLEYVANTSGNIFRLNEQYYILIAGRWFSSHSLDGPWAFVSGKEMPPDFAKIPPESPKATVLASVPGTPESKEALIANSIPQTATITRVDARLTVQYDGEPTFVPIEGLSLQYASNTSAAVIKLSADSYYCVEAGVWFKASSPHGPWVVTDSIPSEIYDIPPSSRLHYVTYVKVYGSTSEVVYVGYTPGYYGTVVSAGSTTVIYGTGWYYAPYIGPTVWYGSPYTYGVGAGFTYASDSGWSFGFSYGYTYYPYWYYPWWGPIGYYGCCWYPYYGWGAWGGAAAANVYGVWGNTAYSRTGAAWANPYTGNLGATTRGGYHNAQTGRKTVAGRGYNTNLYTGATAAYRGGATYNPSTGIVAGAGSGYVGNIYSGQAMAGRGGFVYNTKTNAGIAAGKNNVFAGKDGTVYRYNRDSGSWSSNNGNGWEALKRPEPKLQNQFQMRNQGAQRTQNFNSMRNFGGAGMRSGFRRR